MIIVPYATDAPIYYRPIGTIGLIVVNVLVYLLTCLRPEMMESLVLVHGYGPQPVQWLTSIFVHASFFHLLGNMLFLWPFGLVVEGKLGWYRFIPLYLVIGVLECVIEQVLFSSHTGEASLGASAAVYGLMAIALLWAPSNEMTVFGILYVFFFVRVFTFELSITWFAVLYFLKSMVFVFLFPGPHSETLHMLGALVGAVFGFVLLKMHIVDCENWDLFSVMQGKHRVSSEASMSHSYQSDLTRRSKEKSPRAKKRTHETLVLSSAEAVERFSTLLDAEKPRAAMSTLQKQRHFKPDWLPPLSALLELARQLRKTKQWNDSIEVYNLFIEASPQHSSARLELAELLVLVRTRPASALRVLQECQREDLKPGELKRLDSILEQAHKMADSGILEIRDE